MSQKKQLQRLKLAEDERKLQTKLFVKLRVWKPKGCHHRLMMVEIKTEIVSTEKSGLFLCHNELKKTSRSSGKGLSTRLFDKNGF